MKREDLFEAWIDALESGRFKQTRYRLVENGKKNPSYCCLGVACVVSNERKAMKQIDIYDEIHENFLPRGLAKKLGIDRKGTFTILVKYRGRYYGSLMELNDGGVRLPIIARIIREQLTVDNFEPYEK